MGSNFREQKIKEESNHKIKIEKKKELRILRRTTMCLRSLVLIPSHVFHDENTNKRKIDEARRQNKPAAFFHLIPDYISVTYAALLFINRSLSYIQFRIQGIFRISLLNFSTSLVRLPHFFFFSFL